MRGPRLPQEKHLTTTRVLDKESHLYENAGTSKRPVLVRKGKERKTLVINTEPQPWQKVKAK